MLNLAVYKNIYDLLQIPKSEQIPFKRRYNSTLALGLPCIIHILHPFPFASTLLATFTYLHAAGQYQIHLQLLNVISDPFGRNKRVICIKGNISLDVVL